MPVPSPFAKVRAGLWEDRGLVIFGRCIVVPATKRKRVVDRLHDAHLGEERTLRRARQTVYWPGIDSDIRNKVRGCEPCQWLRPSQGPEELLRDPTPTFVFQEIAVDYGEVQNKHFLIDADRWSDFPAIYPVPGYLTSANRRLTASYPQSNGLAEVSVKAVKHLLSKTGGAVAGPEFLEGLLAYRVTPRDRWKEPFRNGFRADHENPGADAYVCSLRPGGVPSGPCVKNREVRCQG